MPLLTLQVFNVHTSEVAQSILVVGGVVPDDAIIFAREVIKPAVDRRHPGQVIQHFLHLLDEFLEGQKGNIYTILKLCQDIKQILLPSRFLHPRYDLVFWCIRKDRQKNHESKKIQKARDDCGAKNCPPPLLYYCQLSLTVEVYL